jgi:hypothetical protein
MKITRSIFIVLLLFVSSASLAQQLGVRPPELGKPAEDYTFTHVENFGSKKISISDFRGRWLFLDFWYAGCTANVKSMPEVKKYKDALSKEMDFLLVVQNDNFDRDIQSIFPKLQRELGTNFAVAYDSMLNYRWDIWAMPYFVLIDPTGTVRLMNDGRDLTLEKIRNVMDGKQIDVHMGRRYSERFRVPKYNNELDSGVLYRSVLTRWNNERPTGLSVEMYASDPDSYPDGILQVAMPLAWLYEKAYGGSEEWTVRKHNGELLYPFAMIETSERKLFEYDTSGLSTNGIYNFNLKVHPLKARDRAFIYRAMQSELKNIFGFEVSIEKRKMAVWRFIAKPGAAEKLRSKDGQSDIQDSPLHLTARNIPLNQLIRLLSYGVNNRKRVFIIENETGFEGNIDIHLEALMTDFNNLKAALNKMGFDFRKEMVEMNVIVIKDPLL